MISVLIYVHNYVINLIDTSKVIRDYLDDAWWVKENSNVPKSNTGLNNAISRAACKEFWLKEVYPEYVTKAYENGLFHIHNLGQLAGYCAGWSLEELLLNGFGGGRGRQRSRPAKRLGTALGQGYNDLYSRQNEFDGAEAYNNFDTFMAPFIFYGNHTQEEVDQEVQVFLYCMNIRTRRGDQQPFTNVTLDQTPPKFMEDEHVIIGGKRMPEVYGDFVDEMEMFNKAWWKQRIAGDADGRPQPFPIETLNVTSDFNWDDELLFEATAMRGSPYFANFISTGRDPSEIRSMCCRLGLDVTQLARKNGGYFGAGDKTGSIGVCTMNLPLIAYLSRTEDVFFELLGRAMDIAKDSLEIKRDADETGIEVCHQGSSLYAGETARVSGRDQ
jgi:ribonucleoside-triphosphate reductase